MNGRLSIRPIGASDVNGLEASMPTGPEGRHGTHLEEQERGEVVYLVAHLGSEPVGHLLLSWHRPNPEEAPGAPADRPHVSEFGVRPDLQSRGIGSKMLMEAERRARWAGATELGLSVEVENSRALALYRRHGYRVVDAPPFVYTYETMGRDGRRHLHHEACVDMSKCLAPWDKRDR